MKRKSTILFAFFSALLFSSVSLSKVFDMKKASVGSYFMFSGGPSKVKDSAFASESTATSYEADVNTQTAGEFGIVYTVSMIGFRFGFEFLKPEILKGNRAYSGSTALYEVDSQIIGYSPKFGVDINWKTGSWYRLFMNGYVGSASVEVTNSYFKASITPGAHIVDMKGSGIMWGGGLGAEVFLMDSTTFVLETGYRVLKIGKLKYSKDVTTFNGTFEKGDEVLDTNGASRQLDMGGLTVGAGFRFYF